jgi:hypothetical protein
MEVSSDASMAAVIVDPPGVRGIVRVLGSPRVPLFAGRILNPDGLFGCE